MIEIPSARRACMFPLLCLAGAILSACGGGGGGGGAVPSVESKTISVVTSGLTGTLKIKGSNGVTTSVTSESPTSLGSFELGQPFELSVAANPENQQCEIEPATDEALAGDTLVEARCVPLVTLLGDVQNLAAQDLIAVDLPGAVGDQKATIDGNIVVNLVDVAGAYMLRIPAGLPTGSHTLEIPLLGNTGRVSFSTSSASSIADGPAYITSEIDHHIDLLTQMRDAAPDAEKAGFQSMIDSLNSSRGHVGELGSSEALALAYWLRTLEGPNGSGAMSAKAPSLADPIKCGDAVTYARKVILRIVKVTIATGVGGIVGAPLGPIASAIGAGIGLALGVEATKSLTDNAIDKIVNNIQGCYIEGLGGSSDSGTSSSRAKAATTSLNLPDPPVINFLHGKAKARNISLRQYLSLDKKTLILDLQRKVAANAGMFRDADVDKVLTLPLVKFLPADPTQLQLSGVTGSGISGVLAPSGAQTSLTFRFPDSAPDFSPKPFAYTLTLARSGAADVSQEFHGILSGIKPRAFNRSFNTRYNEVLSNGRLAGEAAESFKIETTPQHGMFSLLDAAAGVFSYAPNADFTGIDSFSYRALNSFGQSDLAIVNISVANCTLTQGSNTYKWTCPRGYSEEATILNANQIGIRLDQVTSSNAPGVATTILEGQYDVAGTTQDAFAASKYEIDESGKLLRWVQRFISVDGKFQNIKFTELKDGPYGVGYYKINYHCDYARPEITTTTSFSTGAWDAAAPGTENTTDGAQCTSVGETRAMVPFSLDPQASYLFRRYGPH